MLLGCMIGEVASYELKSKIRDLKRRNRGAAIVCLSSSLRWPMDPVLWTSAFDFQRVRCIRRWCEIKLRMPYPAMKPRANTGVINSTSWINENLPSLDGLIIVLQCDRSETIAIW